jgi:hypothetical protein
MSASSSSDPLIPINALLHMVPFKLTSTNYLLWRHQILPVLSLQILTGHIDGSVTAPAPTITQGDKVAANPAYSIWLTADQKTIVIIQASLSSHHRSCRLNHRSRGLVCS